MCLLLHEKDISDRFMRNKFRKYGSLQVGSYIFHSYQLILKLMVIKSLLNTLKLPTFVLSRKECKAKYLKSVPTGICTFFGSLPKI